MKLIAKLFGFGKRADTVARKRCICGEVQRGPFCGQCGVNFETGRSPQVKFDLLPVWRTVSAQSGTNPASFEIVREFEEVSTFADGGWVRRYPR